MLFMCGSPEEAQQIFKLQQYVGGIQVVRPGAVEALFDALIENSRWYQQLLDAKRQPKICCVAKGKNNVSCVYVTGW